jgi:hypothetical protein
MSATSDEAQERIDSQPEEDDTMGVSASILGLNESEPTSTDSSFDSGGGDFGGAGAGSDY